jgi:hypothetical protein
MLGATPEDRQALQGPFSLFGVAMSSIGTTLLDSLRSIERSGDFCVGGLRHVFMPTIDVDGVGRVSLPIVPRQAEQLVANAEAAPYGRGEETVTDRTVRRTWQLNPGKVHIGGRRWEETLAILVADAARGLGVDDPVAADFYNLLIYDEGSFFIDHRDTEKVAGMFATMVLVLPSIHSGGALVVRHLDREALLDPRPEEPSEIGFAAFYADCVHEVRPVTAGHRITLVYNLRFPGKRERTPVPDYRAEQKQAADLLRRWAETEGAPVKLILPLEHAYTPAELSFTTLKGADAGAASVLVKAAAEADCEIHLSLVTIEESGSAEHTGYYGRRRHRAGDEDEEEFEVVEVFDSALSLSEWRRPDGKAIGFEGLPFDESELCPPDAFEDLTPDDQHFHEATGNEGASFERTYRRAGLVLWPRARRLAVLNQAGPGTTLPYLEDLAERWEASGAKPDSPLWHEADELSGHMLASWPSWRGDEDAGAGRMLAVQTRLKNAPRIETFLTERSAEGHYARRDNEAIVGAVALLPSPRATDLLVRIVSHNAATHLGACADLLLRCSAAPAGMAGDTTRICTALLDALPGNPKRTATKPEPWTVREPIVPGLIVDLLTAASRIDAGLAARAVEHVLAWPELYSPDKVLAPAALTLAWPASASWPAVGRLREAVLQHLRRRIAEPLEPPKDFSRANPLKCSCPDCSDLGTFLLAPDRREWRLKALATKREHVRESIRARPCDIDLSTEKRGSPHTLVAVKNQASYERRVQQRRQDLEQVAALGG